MSIFSSGPELSGIRDILFTCQRHNNSGFLLMNYSETLSRAHASTKLETSEISDFSVLGLCNAIQVWFIGDIVYYSWEMIIFLWETAVTHPKHIRIDWGGTTSIGATFRNPNGVFRSSQSIIKCEIHAKIPFWRVRIWVSVF